MSKRMKWSSTPVVNYVFDWSDVEKDAFHDEVMAMHLAPRTVCPGGYKREEWTKPVDFFKGVMGDQDYVWVGEFRFWIWERGDWRVFVSNIQGISVELREGLTKEQARAAWDDFRARIGLYCPFAIGQIIHAYRNNELGTVVGLCDLYPGCVLVRMKDDGKIRSIQLGNIVAA